MAGSYNRSDNPIKKHKREFKGRYTAELDNAYPRMNGSLNKR